MNITTKQMDITPAWAAKVLEEHWRRIEKEEFRQRNLSLSTVNKFAAEMINGNWILSPQSIDFDEKGNLINGQHRLEAVRRSGKTVPMMVSTGWPTKTIDVIDQGRPRSLAALLQLSGNKNACALASTINQLCRIPHRGSTAGLTFVTATQLMDEMNMLKHIEAIVSMSRTGKNFIGRVVGPLAYYHSVRPNKAKAFAESLFNFETTKGSPVQLYLNWIQSKRHMKGGGGEIHLRGFCSCIRAWENNEQPSVIRPTVEAIQWLADLNPVLRDWVRKHISRAGSWKGGIAPQSIKK